MSTRAYEHILNELEYLTPEERRELRQRLEEREEASFSRDSSDESWDTGRVPTEEQEPTIAPQAERAPTWVTMVEGASGSAQGTRQERPLSADAKQAQIEAWFAAADELAAKVGAAWKDDMTAVEAVREQRREL